MAGSPELCESFSGSTNRLPFNKCGMKYLLSPVQKVTHEAGREMQSVVAKSQIEQNTYARCRLELAPISLSQRRKGLDRNAGTDSKSNYC